MQKTGLLVLLGVLWSLLIAAIKAAGLAGVPVHVLVSVAMLGIAACFTARALIWRDWPPLDLSTGRFYVLTGLFGSLAPFVLESAVAPHLPVFLFVVIIATTPLVTLTLSVLAGGERLRAASAAAVGLGFAGALAILWQTAAPGSLAPAPAWWVAAAFGVPFLYALNSVYVATRWPVRAGGVHVAHAQAGIVALAALVGSAVTGAIADWPLAARAAPALRLIVICEVLALLVYLRVARTYGATYVSFANYVSMVFGALLGAVWFGDRLSWGTVAAALVIVASVALYQWQGRSRTPGAA